MVNFTGINGTYPTHDDGFLNIVLQFSVCIYIYKNGQFRLCPEDCIHEFALPQLLLFLKGFTESERNKLAMLTGILLANGNLSASILSSLFNENLVKEGTCFSDS